MADFCAALSCGNIPLASADEEPENGEQQTSARLRKNGNNFIK
jgi:hypothetical protein